MTGREIGRAPYYGEGAAFPLQGAIQYWNLVDDSRPQRLLTGTITCIKKNASDNDWNIFVRPDPQFRYLTQNSFGHTNATGEKGEPCAGSEPTIELELHNLALDKLNFELRFGVDDWIEAYGWWVEDAGHCAEDGRLIGKVIRGITDLITQDLENFCVGKTELHPFCYIIWGRPDIPESSQFKIFMAHETSGRFDVEEERLSHRFSISMPSESIRLSISDPINEYDIALHGQILKEHSVMDANRAGTIFQSQSESREGRKNYRTRKIIRLTNNEIHYDIIMRPKNEFIEPMYYGHFYRRNGDYTNLHIKPEIQSDQSSGYKLLLFKVKANVLPIPEQNIVITNSRWFYDESTSTSNETRDHPLNSAPHEIDYELKYAPGLGWTENNWGFTVITSDKTDFTSDGEEIIDRQGGDLGLWGHRSFIIGKASLYLVPSTISLGIKEILQEFRPPRVLAAPDISDVDGQLQCVVGYTVDLEENYIPGISSLNIRWGLQFVTDPSGNPVVLANDIEIPTDGSWANRQDVGNRVSVICSGPSRVELRFETSSVFVTGSDNVLVDHHNHTRVVLTVWVETELGEILTQSQEFSLRGCIAGVTWEEYFERIQTLSAVYERLQELGVWTNPFSQPQPWPPQRIIDEWSLFNAVGIGNLGAFRNLDFQYRGVDISIALERFIQGLPVSQEELQIVQQAYDFGSQLPRFTNRRVPLPLATSSSILPGQIPLPMQRGVNFIIELKFHGRSARIKRGGTQIFKEWAERLTNDPFANLIIATYTDDAGSDSENLNLAQKRANYIKGRLVKHGINPNRIIAVGYGTPNPNETFITPEGSALNNRIEFHIQ